MAKRIRIHADGRPRVSCAARTSPSAAPGPGQARLRHVAVGLNFADTYFRTGLYPVPLPDGMGVEAAGVVEAVGEGVTNVAPGDRVTYTGFLNTLGAYSTERVDPGGAADQAAARDLLRDRGGDDDARTHLRVPACAASIRSRRATPSCCTLRQAASASSCRSGRSSSGLTVIGTVSSEAEGGVARAHGCDHVIDYTARRCREARARAHRRHRRGRRLRQRRQGHLRGSLDSLKRRGLLVCVGTASGPIPPIDATQLAIKGSAVRHAAGARRLHRRSRGEERARRRALRPRRRGAHQDRDQPALRAARTRRRPIATSNRARRPARRSSSI